VNHLSLSLSFFIFLSEVAMSGSKANAARDEAALVEGRETLLLRPTFAALCAAKEEPAPLLTLVERAAEGRRGLAETARLFRHCIAERRECCTRERAGEAIAARGWRRRRQCWNCCSRRYRRGLRQAQHGWTV